MEPKPVITYFGDVEILSAVLRKKLQSRLILLQPSSLPKEESGRSAFSSLCCGVEFIHFVTAQARLKADVPFYQRPAVHTFWCGCSDSDRYRTNDRPLIKQWLDSITKMGGGSGGHPPGKSLIIYCVTAEVRAKKQRPLAHVVTSSVEEKLRTDYKALADDIIILRLASSEEARLMESFNASVSKLNSMALHQFMRAIELEESAVSCKRGVRSDPEKFYHSLFIKKLDLAVGYEMTLNNKKALELYSEATMDLENALTMFTDASSTPKWLEKIYHAPCTSWDYPKLAWTQLSWQYLSEIRSCSSPLLHTRTFLLVRVAHLLFLLERAWSVSELVINTLHCMAREIKMLRLSFQDGTFDCWAYMTCNEAIQAFMARISPDSLVSATSSLLLVRAELWHYALQKLHDIGMLCGLMPSSNKLNYDQVLVQHISSGITPVPLDCIDNSFIGVEDQGKKLLKILNDRKLFQTEFLTLGEMVIGAFKHAGRRRMAFRVGTMIAQFHRDLGLMVEAEELLSDICKFYSEDHWSELSTKAYSLLADCQMKLKLEEKHINTMILLASFPPYPAASHDPVQWMNNVIRVAEKSPYQKMLNWEPLLELVRIEFIEERETFSTEDSVELDLVVKFHGPKEIKSLIATVGTRLANSLQRSPTESHTPNRAPHDLSPTNSLANLEDLDLELNTSKFPHSRPIGESTKFRSSGQNVTHISHAVIADMEALGRGGEEGVKGRHLTFTAMKVNLKPGENRIRLKGKASKSGEFALHKVSLKFGSLDFVYTVDPEMTRGQIFSVQDPQVNVDITLSPQEGVFLAGYSQHCKMSFQTSSTTFIPDSAPVRVIVNSNTSLEFLNTLDTNVTPDNDNKTLEHSFTLPHVPPDSSHDCHMIVTLPALQHVQGTTCESHEQLDHLPAWKHGVMVYCDWLSPLYAASLSLIVYEPLRLTCLEHSAKGNCFLQLILENTSPLPLAIKDPLLTAEIDLDKLHGSLPEVIYPQDNYSLLWRDTGSKSIEGKTSGSKSIEETSGSKSIEKTSGSKSIEKKTSGSKSIEEKTSGSKSIEEKTSGSFSINFCPLPPDYNRDKDELNSECTFHPVEFKLLLSNMQMLFEVQGSMEPHGDQTSILIHHMATLVFTIRNITELPPQETHFGTTPTTHSLDYKLGYKVCADEKVWSLQDKGQGVIDVPGPQRKARLNFKIIPNENGPLLIPGLTLYRVPLDLGREELTEGRIFTNAQVYNTSLGQVVNVSTSSGIGR